MSEVLSCYTAIHVLLLLRSKRSSLWLWGWILLQQANMSHNWSVAQLIQVTGLNSRYTIFMAPFDKSTSSNMTDENELWVWILLCLRKTGFCVAPLCSSSTACTRTHTFVYRYNNTTVCILISSSFFIYYKCNYQNSKCLELKLYDNTVILNILLQTVL